MSEESKFGEEAWSSSLDALTLQLRALHALRQTFDPAYRDGRTKDPAGDELAKRSQDFLFGLARLQLDHFRQVLEFSNKQFDTVVEHLRRAGQTGMTLGGAPRVEVTVAGRTGGTASARFVIQNFRGRPAEMRFVTSEFAADEGKRKTTLPVTIEATKTEYGSVLEPFATAEFEIGVELAAGSLPLGRYRARSYVMDKDIVTGVVDIVLDVTSVRGAAARAGAHPARGRRKGRRRGR